MDFEEEIKKQIKQKQKIKSEEIIEKERLGKELTERDSKKRKKKKEISQEIINDKGIVEFLEDKEDTTPTLDQTEQTQKISKPANLEENVWVSHQKGDTDKQKKENEPKYEVKTFKADYETVQDNIRGRDENITSRNLTSWEQMKSMSSSNDLFMKQRFEVNPQEKESQVKDMNYSVDSKFEDIRDVGRKSKIDKLKQDYLPK